MCFSGKIPQLCTKLDVVTAQYNIMHKTDPYEWCNDIWSKLSWLLKLHFNTNLGTCSQSILIKHIQFISVSLPPCYTVYMTFYHLLHNSSLCSSTLIFSSLQLWNTQCNLYTPGLHCCDCDSMWYSSTASSITPTTASLVWCFIQGLTHFTNTFQPYKGII
jgi:hypothetical protein